MKGSCWVFILAHVLPDTTEGPYELHSSPPPGVVGVQDVSALTPSSCTVDVSLHTSLTYTLCLAPFSTCWHGNAEANVSMLMLAYSSEHSGDCTNIGMRWDWIYRWKLEDSVGVTFSWTCATFNAIKPLCARAAGFGEHTVARRTDRLLLEMGGA